MSFIGALTVVEDISLICDLKSGESPYRVDTLYPSDVPNGDLEGWAERLVQPFGPPPKAYAYTDVGGIGTVVDASDDVWEESVLHAEYVHETMIVMAHIYEEV